MRTLLTDLPGVHGDTDRYVGLIFPVLFTLEWALRKRTHGPRSWVWGAADVVDFRKGLRA